MSKILSAFLGSRRGSFAPIAAVLTIPVVVAVGLAVDYSSGTTRRADMQNSLDSAALAIVTLPKDMSKTDREAKLQAAYLANGGTGTAKLDSYSVDATDGTVRIGTSAAYDMPTTFMRMARIDNVGIGVKASINKKPALIEATFQIQKVSGHWGKTMTLYGKKYGQTSYKKLMEISYVYNNFGDPKGYGTTTISTPTVLGVMVPVEQQACTTGIVSSFSGAPAGSIQQTSGSTKYLTVCSTSPANSTGTKIDVSEMEDLYLQMDVPSGNPKKLKSNDPTTSNRLYIGDVEVESGKTVDIFSSVSCGTSGSQAWEDGGNAVPAPVANADFFYTVSGKCDFSQRMSQTTVTR